MSVIRVTQMLERYNKQSRKLAQNIHSINQYNKMVEFNLDEVRIVDDNLSELEILKEVIDGKDGEEPIHMLDVGDIVRKHHLWIEKMPRVVPYYGIQSFENCFNIL